SSRWEIASAVAGAILGINPFTQPDVEASKDVTRELSAAYEQSGALPPESPIFREDGIALYADPRNAALAAAVGGTSSLVGYLKAHLDRLGAGDYFATLAYLERSPEHEAQLQAIR